MPVFTHNSFSEGGTQLCPCGINGYPQHFTVASGADIHMPTAISSNWREPGREGPRECASGVPTPLRRREIMTA